MYTITFNHKKFKTSADVESFCENIIENYKQIEYCYVNEIVEIPDCNLNPC